MTTTPNPYQEPRPDPASGPRLQHQDRREIVILDQDGNTTILRSAEEAVVVDDDLTRTLGLQVLLQTADGRIVPVDAKAQLATCTFCPTRPLLTSEAVTACERCHTLTCHRCLAEIHDVERLVRLCPSCLRSTRCARFWRWLFP